MSEKHAEVEQRFLIKDGKVFLENDNLSYFYGLNGSLPGEVYDNGVLKKLVKI